MRKITQEAISSLIYEREYNKDNTSVHQAPYNPDKFNLTLHRNVIARKNIRTSQYEITTAGWNTNTTKERLRAIPGVLSLVTRKGKLFLNGEEWDGEWKTL